MRKPTGRLGVAIMPPVSETCIVVTGTDPEVRDLIAEVDAMLGEAAVRSQIHMKQTGERQSPSENEITGRLRWLRASSPPTAAACPLRHAVSATGSATVTGIAISTGPAARDATMTATMTESARTERRSESGSIGAAMIEVRMTSFPMEMSDPQDHDDVVQMTRTTTLAETHETRETPRHVPSPRLYQHQ